MLDLSCYIGNILGVTLNPKPKTELQKDLYVHPSCFLAMSGRLESVQGLGGFYCKHSGSSIADDEVF